MTAITPQQFLDQVDHIAAATRGARDDNKERLALMLGLALITLISINPAYAAGVARIEEMTGRGVR